MSQSVNTLLLILTACLTVGCANKHISNQDQVEISTIQQAQEFSDDSEQALIEAEKEYEDALKNEMDFYAPLHMKQAKSALKIAQIKELDAKKSESLNASSQALNLLRSAKKNKAEVERILSNILKQKKILDELKTSRILTSEYSTLIGKIKEIIQEIEAGKVENVLDKTDGLLIALETLELNTILAIHWLPAQKTLLKAKDEGASDFAEKSFLLATDAVNKAESLIRLDFKNRLKVEENGMTALRAAQKALYTARDAEYLVRLNEAQAEDAVLRIQDLMGKIGTALNSKDVRHMALEDQVNALAQIAETQASRLSANLNERITQLETQLKIKNSKEALLNIEVPKSKEIPDIQPQ